MLKKLGLSAVLIFASMAVAQPAAMAAGRDDFRGGNNYQSRDRGGARNDNRDNREFRDVRNRGEEHFEQQRAPEWREHDGFRFTARFGDRDHDGR
jgi:hypothetical protein